MSQLAQSCLTRRWWNLIEDNAAKVRKAQSFWALPLAGAVNFPPMPVTFEHADTSRRAKDCHDTGHSPNQK